MKLRRAELVLAAMLLGAVVASDASGRSGGRGGGGHAAGHSGHSVGQRGQSGHDGSSPTRTNAGTGNGNTSRTFTGSRTAPPLDQERKVNEQDCSKPIDLSTGNLRCR
jgi:hypothetical protein